MADRAKVRSGLPGRAAAWRDRARLAIEWRVLARFGRGVLGNGTVWLGVAGTVWASDGLARRALRWPGGLGFGKSWRGTASAGGLGLGAVSLGWARNG